MRRDETLSRRATRVVEFDEKRQMVKVNPIVAWTSEQVDEYIAANGVLVNPLATTATVDRLPDLHDARRARRGPALWPVGGDRQDRVRHPRLTPLVAVAHGSRDPRAAATVTELLSAVRARAARHGLPGLDVRAAFLDHCAPSLPQVLGLCPPPVSGGGPAVVVPLLLTAAYHSKADIPARLAAAAAARPGLEAVSAGTLGPHALLLTALERRLKARGVTVADADAP